MQSHIRNYKVKIERALGLLPVGSGRAPRIVLGTECSVHCGCGRVKALGLNSNCEHRIVHCAFKNIYFADYYQPVAAGATTEQFICGVYLDKNVDMKDGKYFDPRYPDADLDIVADAIHNGLKILPFAVIHPLPLILISGYLSILRHLVAKVAVQDIRAGIEGLIAIVEIRGNSIVGANPRGRFAGILDGNDLVDVVCSLGLAIGVLFALCRADDRHQKLITSIGNKAGMVLIALLLDQLDFDAASGERIVSIVGIGEIGQRCAHDCDRDERNAEANRCDLLFLVLLLLIKI